MLLVRLCLVTDKNIILAKGSFGSFFIYQSTEPNDSLQYLADELVLLQIVGNIYLDKKIPLGGGIPQSLSSIVLKFFVLMLLINLIDRKLIDIMMMLQEHLLLQTVRHPD